ncbi:MAG: hypothetical protein ACK47B_17205 [Armatimonadota bacterium]
MADVADEQEHGRPRGPGLLAAAGALLAVGLLLLGGNCAAQYPPATNLSLALNPTAHAEAAVSRSGEYQLTLERVEGSPNASRGTIVCRLQIDGAPVSVDYPLREWRTSYWTGGREGWVFRKGLQLKAGERLVLEGTLRGADPELPAAQPSLNLHLAPEEMSRLVSRFVTHGTLALSLLGLAGYLYALERRRAAEWQESQASLQRWGEPD